MALAELAALQHGVVSVHQLRALGLTDDDVRYRVLVGRLHRLHRGVYAVGHTSLSADGRWLAAVLAVGDGACLSHLSAAQLWGVWDGVTRAVDVTTTARRGQRAGVRVHAVRALDPNDITSRRGIPVTTPARTLLDLADVLYSDRALRRATHEAEVQRRVRQPELVAQLTRANGRRGAARLAAIIARGPAPTRSELEDRTLDLLERNGFPRPLVNAVVCGLEVDFYLPAHGLVIEVDGDRYHGTPLAREEDARRQAILEAAGLRVIRLTWAQVTDGEAQTVRRLRAATAPGRRGNP